MSSSTPSSSTVLDVIDDLGPPGTPLTTLEVAKKFECTPQTISTRLDTLVDAGPLECKTVGAHGRIWWRPLHEHHCESTSRAETPVTDVNNTGSESTSGERYQTFFESIDKGFCTFEVLFDENDGPLDYRFLETNPAFEELTGLTDARGQRMRDLEPDHEDHWFETYGRVALSGEPKRFTTRAEHLGDRWYDVYASRIGDPQERRVAVLFDDISARKRRSRHEQFMLDLSDQIRTLESEQAVGETCTRLLAKELDLDRSYFVRFDSDEKRVRVGPEYHSSGLDPVSGLYPFSAFPKAIQQIQTETPVYDDVANDPTLPEEERQALLALDFGAWIGVPIRVDTEQTDWALYAVTSEPHHWTDAEVSLVEEAAERTWSAVERARTEEKLRESEERLRLATNAAEIGVWELDLQTNESPERSPHHDEIFGYEEPIDDWNFEIFLDHVHEEDRERVRERFEEAFETGEWTFECQIVRTDGEQRWISAEGEFYETDDGEPVRAVGVIEDITERKERERRLAEQREQIEHLQNRLLETSPTGILIVGADGEITLANERAGEIVGLSAGELTGLRHDTPELDIVDTNGEPLSEEKLPFEQITRSDEAVFNAEVGIRRSDGERVWLSVNGAPLYEDDELTEVVVTIEDITERKRREEALRDSEERFRGLVAATSDVMYRMSPEWDEMRELTGGGFLSDTENPSDDWLNKYIHPEDQPRVTSAIDEAIRTKQPFELEHRVYKADGRVGWTLSRAVPLLADDEITEWFGSAKDITKRKQTEAALERLNDSARELLNTGAAEIMNRTAEIARQVLDIELAALWRYDGDTGELELHRASTDQETALADIAYPDGFDERVWNTFVANELEVDNDLSPASEIGPSEQPIRSGILVSIGRHGVLCVGSLSTGTFDEEMVDLAKTVAATLETALDRADREKRLEAQNNQLARLERTNSVIREIAQVLVEADSRDEIERAVCERLTTAEQYALAWIGEQKAGSNTVHPRAFEGIGTSYIDAITVTADDTESGRGAVGTAIRTKQTHVVEDILADPAFAPWRESALDHGFRSCIGVPLLYEESTYGVLSVYADESHAFGGMEQEVLTELGETIAHAIAAIETRQSLHTDRIVELDLQFRNINTVLVRLARDADCRLEFDGLVPGDHTSRLFFTAHETSPDRVLAAGEASMTVDSIVCLAERDDECVFELVTRDSTLASILVEHEATVRTFSTDGEETLGTVTLPSTADVRAFIDTVQDQYPNTELVARHDHDRPLQSRHELHTRFEDQLTDRQQEILRTAYQSGFFESPRVRTGRELSDALGISQPTFIQHLRTAQRKLLAEVFDNRTAINVT